MRWRRPVCAVVKSAAQNRLCWLFLEPTRASLRREVCPKKNLRTLLWCDCKNCRKKQAYHDNGGERPEEHVHFMSSFKESLYPLKKKWVSCKLFTSRPCEIAVVIEQKPTPTLLTHHTTSSTYIHTTMTHTQTQHHNTTDTQTDRNRQRQTETDRENLWTKCVLGMECATVGNVCVVVDIVIPRTSRHNLNKEQRLQEPPSSIMSCAGCRCLCCCLCLSLCASVINCVCV